MNFQRGLIPHHHSRNYTDHLAIIPASFVGKESLNSGNKILLPASALQQVLYMKQKGPMIFKIKSMMNPNKFTYAGVLEFTAEEGNCVLPEWMFDNMQFFSGCLAEITLVSNLPRGKLIKIQPHETAFIDLPDPRAILENHLRNFICLTEGETITLKFHNTDYQIDIVKVTPETEHKAVCINEADVEIDFMQPLDYSEAPPNLVKKSSSLVQQEESQQQQQQFFCGTGLRIDGKSGQTQLRKPSEDIKVVEPYNPRKNKLVHGIRPTEEINQFSGTSVKLGQASLKPSQTDPKKKGI